MKFFLRYVVVYIPEFVATLLVRRAVGDDVVRQLAVRLQARVR